MDDGDLVTRTATCHTDGCLNAEAAIALVVLDDVDAFICGPCGQPITDITPA